MRADLDALTRQLATLDDGESDSVILGRAIAAALARYAKDKPRRLVADVACLGAQVELPEDFEQGFSVVTEVAIPPGAAPLSADAWELQETPAGQVLRLRDSASGQARLRYTRSHIADDETYTIPAADTEAVASWAASVVCEGRASEHAGDMLPSINADSVDHVSKSRDYAARARRLREQYYSLLGIQPDRLVPAGAVAAMHPTGRVELLQRGRR